MKKVILISFVLALHAGCGSDEPTLSQGEAQQAATVIMGASSVGLSSFDVNGMAGQIEVTGSGGCLGGGTVEVDGQVNAAATSISYDLDMTITGCRQGNVTVDGAISYSGSSSSSSVSYSLSGEVTLSGAINGTCALSLDQTLDFETSAFALTGSVCGHSITVTVAAQ